MPNSFTVEIDGAQMREELEGESLRAVIKSFIRVASRESADHIRQEAANRLERQLVPGVGKGFGGHATGATVKGIVVKSDRTGWGWIVDAGNVSMPMLDRWLEKGTKQMPARPFFWSSAQLEESSHLARVQAAIQAALSEYGLAGGQT